MLGHLLVGCSFINLLHPVMQRVFETQFLGRPAIIKQRFSKQYRHPTLDAKLTTSRLKQVCKERHLLLTPAAASPQPANPSAACLLQEVRSILRARKIGVACPVVYYVEQEAATIYMEQIQGRSVKALISDGKITEAGGAMVPCTCCIAPASAAGPQGLRQGDWRSGLAHRSRWVLASFLHILSHKSLQHTSSSEDELKEAGEWANSQHPACFSCLSAESGMGCKHAGRGRRWRPPSAGTPSFCSLS